MKYILSVLAAVSLINLTYAEDPWTPSSLCPYPSEDLTRSPYQGDCTKYWECFEGARYVMTCPSGLEYNKDQARCDTPTIAHCDADATYSYPTYTTAVFVPDPDCPYPSSSPTYYPCATNCQQYYECWQGTKSLKDCPSNLYWSVDHDWCDYIENVDCSKNALPTPPIGPVTTVTPIPWHPDPQCPYPSEEVVFFPFPANCSEYYECFEGNKFLMDCPTDLYWNARTNSCDFLENVDCRDIPVPTKAPGTTPAATSCSGKSDGTLLPNPNDCSKFYECVGGKIVDEQCPAGLLWNQAIQTCDYPNDVNCQH